MIYNLFIAYILTLARVTAATGLHNVSRSEFRSVIAQNDAALVAFFSSWTESSKLLEPEWSLAATQTKQPLITIDCAAETELCEENHVVSLPAIRLFKGKKSTDRYRGPRKASAIVPYVRRSTLPVVSFLDSTNITSFKGIDRNVFIAYLSPKDDDLKAIFESLAARNYHRFSFAIATDVRLANAGNLPIPSLVCYTASEGEQEVFSGEWRLKILGAFIEKSTAPLIGELTRRNEIKYLQSGKSLIYIFYLTSRERSNYLSALKPLTKKYREYISFVTVDAGEYAHMAPGLGLEEGGFPALALQNPMFGQVFPFDVTREVSEETVEAWVLDIVAGRITPWAGQSSAGSKKDGGQEGSLKDEL